MPEGRSINFIVPKWQEKNFVTGKKEFVGLGMALAKKFVVGLGWYEQKQKPKERFHIAEFILKVL